MLVPNDILVLDSQKSKWVRELWFPSLPFSEADDSRVTGKAGAVRGEAAGRWVSCGVPSVH